MLELKNLTIRFGGLTAVDKLSLKINKNQIYGLIGPNGAGKTTVFNVISGVYKPTEGDIFFKNNSIGGKEPHAINKLGIAMTYQNINLFKSMTVLENVMVGFHTKIKSGFFATVLRLKSQKKEEQEVIEKSLEILKFFNLEDKANYLAQNLSYGEQRRLEISRALASQPDVLLLDEPAAGMNTKEKIDLTEHIRKIRDKNITIFMVEHDMKLVMGLTDQICVLNYGKKIAEGKPEEIQNNPAVIEAYLGGE